MESPKKDFAEVEKQAESAAFSGASWLGALRTRGREAEAVSRGPLEVVPAPRDIAESHHQMIEAAPPNEGVDFASLA